MPAAFVPGRERPEPPAYGRDRMRPEPPAYGRGRDQGNGVNVDPRREAPPSGNGQAMPAANGNGQGFVKSPVQSGISQAAIPASKVDEPKGNAPDGKGRGRDDERSQKRHGGKDGKDKDQEEMSPEEQEGTGKESGKKRGRE